MNTRCFLLPAVFVMLLVVSWSPAGDLPQAPPPREKKTTAQLLVGIWKQIQRNGKPVPNEWAYYREFTANNQFHFFLDDRKNPPTVTTGTYTLSDKTLRLHTQFSPQGRERTWSVTIESITESTLSITFTGEGQKEAIILQRVAKE